MSFRNCRKLLWLFALLSASCGPEEGPRPSRGRFIEVAEVVGAVSDSSAEVFLQLDADVTPRFAFKMAYDTVPHPQDRDYPFETPKLAGMGPGEKVVFSIPDDLDPDTRYYYRTAYRQSPDERWAWRPEGSFHTRRAPGSPFRFCVISDFHDSTPPLDPGVARIARNVADDEPDFVVSLGDMVPVSNQGAGDPPDCGLTYLVYFGFGEPIASWYYVHAFSRIFNEFSHSSSLVWVNGNHEGLAGYLSACTEYAWTLNARNKYVPLLGDAEPNGFFGDFVWGDVHIIWLDPLAFSTYDPYMLNRPEGYALGAVQREWLEDTLAGSSSRWKLIFAHTLFGGAGPNFDCLPGRAYARGNANFVHTQGTDQIHIQSLMEDYGVNAYVYGHDHMYSVSEYGDSGVQYILAGTGQEDDWTRCLERRYAPWEVLRNDRGHLRVDVNTDSLIIHYIKSEPDETNGEILATHEIVPAPEE
jgi:3',5'-cyclic AMP phosphodiesterase CpdA